MASPTDLIAAPGPAKVIMAVPGRRSSSGRGQEAFMTEILLSLGLVLAVVTMGWLWLLWRRVAQLETTSLVSRLDAFEKAQERTERSVR